MNQFDSVIDAQLFAEFKRLAGMRKTRSQELKERADKTGKGAFLVRFNAEKSFRKKYRRLTA